MSFKDWGYVVLPVVIPAGDEPHDFLVNFDQAGDLVLDSTFFDLFDILGQDHGLNARNDGGDEMGGTGGREVAASK